MANRTATFHFAKPVAGLAGGTRWIIKLEQNFGQHHTFGRLRLSLGQAVSQSDPRPLEVRRRDELDQHFQAWLAAETPKAVEWTVLKPSEMKTNEALLTLLPDGSVLAGGDKTKRDVYDLKFRPAMSGITAMRLEAIPDASLPEHGPGRTSYEGPFGDFFLSELMLSDEGKPIVFKGASQTFANGSNTAAAAIDGNPLTGWSVGGSAGKANSAVFSFAKPASGGELALRDGF